MSGRDYTATGLIASFRAEGSISPDDPNATEADILLLADRIIERHFVPGVRKALADYYITYDDIALEANVKEYRIPYRAVTSSVRSVVFVDGSDNEFELVPVPPTTRFTYAQARSGYPAGYTIIDDVLCVLPTPANSTGTLRVWYEYRPGKLILPATAALISTISEPVLTDGDNIYAVATTGTFDPADPTPCDVVCGRAPFSVIARDASFDGTVAVLGATLTLDTRWRDPLVGDYICPVGETAFPQIPAELHSALALMMAGEYLKATDPQTSAELIKEAKEARQMAWGMLTPRQHGRQMKLKSTSSRLRGYGVRSGGFGDWRP